MSILKDHPLSTLAVATVVVANLAALGAVARNRTGAPTSTVVLTERELPLELADEEDSGVILRLDWPDRYGSETEWLTADHLRALGFDLSVPADDPRASETYRDVLGRFGYLAYELDGPAWQARLAAQEAALATCRAEDASPHDGKDPCATDAERLAWAQLSASRLVPVDADRDPTKLRARHPEAATVLILPALFDLRHESANGDAPARLRGFVDRLLTPRLVVPKDLAAGTLMAARTADEAGGTAAGPRFSQEPRAPRYAVEVRVGQRYEPWAAAIRPLDPDTR